MKLIELHEEDDLKRKHFGDLLVKVMYKELKPVLTDWLTAVRGQGWIPESTALPGAKYYHENLSYSDEQDSAEAFARDYFDGVVHYMDNGSLHPTRDDTIVFYVDWGSALQRRAFEFLGKLIKSRNVNYALSFDHLTKQIELRRKKVKK